MEETKCTSVNLTPPSLSPTNLTPPHTTNEPDFSLPSNDTTQTSCIVTQSKPISHKAEETIQDNVVSSSTDSVKSKRPESSVGASAYPESSPTEASEGRRSDVADTLFFEKALMQSFVSNIGE